MRSFRASVRAFVTLTILVGTFATSLAAQDRPDTGISGVYEVMVGTKDAEAQIEYFAQFGFAVVKEASLSSDQAAAIYGVDSPLRSIRLQNGNTDAHGLLRILEWAEPIGPGVGYAPPETVGQRMAVMRTGDIFRIYDVFSDLRNESKQPWLPTEPVYDDLYDMDKGQYTITNRRVGVREMAVYGELFNHVFFQRYGYTIPGYGMIDDESPLKSSEFTHHDFNVSGDLDEVTDYYETVLGLIAEDPVTIDGDWLAGPRIVFGMEPGESHYYQGFVSPNNISGKLKFFSARDPEFVRDRSQNQRIGELGITLHSFFTPKLAMVRELAEQNDLNPTDIVENEFGEQSFLFVGPDGVAWQILEAPDLTNEPLTELEFQEVNN